MTTILIVDDEEDIREVIRNALEAAGFRTVEASDIESARASIRTEHPDLVLLDWMLPGLSGVSFARQLKQRPATRDIPIIMLTARGVEADRVQGLDAGCDDYVTKPFSARELIARIKAVSRRRKRPGTDVVSGADVALQIGQLRLDDSGHQVTVAGDPLNIAPTEYRLLRFFMTNPNRAFSRAQLIDRVWGERAYMEQRTVDVHIRRLRKVLEPSGHDRLLQTVRGLGYRFSADA